MNIALPALIVAFGASCVWLMVRIINRRERWAKRTLTGLILGLPVLYVASFGPVCWWLKSSETEGGVVVNIAPAAYWPMGWLAQNGPEPVARAINWYGTVWVYWIHVPVNPDGDRWKVLVQNR